MKPRVTQFGKDANLAREKMREANRRGVELPAPRKHGKVAVETACLADGDTLWENELDWSKVTIDYLHLHRSRQTKGAYKCNVCAFLISENRRRRGSDAPTTLPAVRTPPSCPFQVRGGRVA